MSQNKLTLAHVTHEAVEQLGGIGTVLEGLISSPVYQQRVGRTILVGPTQTHVHADPEKRLGEHGKVLYSSVDQIDRAGLAGRFRPIEWAFNTRVVYGTRQFTPPGQNRSGESEVLLLDVFNTNPDRLSVFKLRMWETFGLDSSRYDKAWDYEEWVRLAEPAYYALLALLNDDDLPCVLFAHEFMGLPTAFQAVLEGQEHFRTVFHGHECATARRLVEHHPGHDTMFYNALRLARERGLYVNDVFGDQHHYFRHALVSRAHLCDGIIAVGDYTAMELQFLDPHFADRPVDVVYNGVPAEPVTTRQKSAARKMLQDYAKALLGYSPDVLMTHVTRPVISKGMWRDVKVCHHLDRLLGEHNRKGVLFILTTGGGVRRPQDVQNMERQYGWPRHHHVGYPDLVGPEVDLWRMLEPFNAGHGNIQIVLVNQFGWSPARIGNRLPREMDIAHLRMAADVEFGMATYEPFGISPLEPLGAGAVCVISNVCGCYGFVRDVADGEDVPNVLCADFTRLNGQWDIQQLVAMDMHQRDQIEHRVAADVAQDLFGRLPTTDAQRRRLIDSGQKLASAMGWDQVIERRLLPMLDRITVPAV